MGPGTKARARPAEAEIAHAMGLALADYEHLLGEIHGCQLVLYYQAHEDGEQESSFLDQHAHGGARGEDPLGPLEQSLREIGAVLPVMQSRGCQLHSQAISRLRGLLGDLVD